MIQTSGMRKRRGASTTATGRAGVWLSHGRTWDAVGERVPDQAGVEAHGGKHGEHHHGAEGHGARAGLDGGEPLELTSATSMVIT
jgi:hypothetical protein